MPPAVSVSKGASWSHTPADYSLIWFDGLTVSGDDGHSGGWGSQWLLVVSIGFN